MTNLEIMEKGLNYTNEAYVRSVGQMIPEDLSQKTSWYSAQALYGVLTSPNGMSVNYTRQDNLRYDMASLGNDAIKNELLKNIATVATYHVLRDTRAGKEIGDRFSAHMDSDQVAVVLFNNITTHGVEKGYELLKDPNLLFHACYVFAQYRSPGKKEAMDQIASTNNGVMYVHNELDTYYRRHGDKKMVPKGDPFGDNIGFGGK